MIKKSLLLVTCFTYLISFTQQNYQPATIVTMAGETLKGEIDYRNWKETPATIRFRTDKSTPHNNFGVADLQSFSVAGDVYKRAIVEVVRRKDVAHDVSVGENLEIYTDTLFLLTVVSGPKSLYYYTNNVDHFYISSQNEFELLKYRKYKLESEVINPASFYSTSSRKFVATDKDYIAQLNAYLSGCSGVRDDTKYDVQGLRGAFVSYYDCVGTRPEYLQKEEKYKFELSLIAGASNTTFDVKSVNNQIVGKVPFSASTDFAAGVSFDLVFPRRRGRISLNNELMYSAYSTEGEYHLTTAPTLHDDYHFRFEYSYLKLNTMLRYKFFTNSAIFFINGGLSNGMALREVNSLTSVHTFNGDKTTTTSKGFEDTRKYELGFLAGGGIRRNRISAELRVEKGQGSFNASGMRAEVMRYFALLSYRVR